MNFSSNEEIGCPHQPISHHNTCFRDARLQIYTPLCGGVRLQHPFSRVPGGTVTLVAPQKKNSKFSHKTLLNHH
jgi:hypothetical protein